MGYLSQGEQIKNPPKVLISSFLQVVFGKMNRGGEWLGQKFSYYALCVFVC